jgi:hypothetical protein
LVLRITVDCNKKHNLGNVRVPLLVFNSIKKCIGEVFHSILNLLFDEQHVSALARYEHRTACRSSWEVRGMNYWNQLKTEVAGHYYVKAPIPPFSIIILTALYYLHA